MLNFMIQKQAGRGMWTAAVILKKIITMKVIMILKKDGSETEIHEERINMNDQWKGVD